MSTADTLLCEFMGKVEEQHGRYVVEIPEFEVTHGTLSAGAVCQFSVQTVVTDAGKSPTTSRGPSPPVATGERYTVEIEDVGDLGDGAPALIVATCRPFPMPHSGGNCRDSASLPNYGLATVVGSNDATVA